MPKQTLPTSDTSPTSDTRKYAPKYIPIGSIIDLIEVKGLTKAQAAKVLGCDHSNISQRLKAIDYVPEYLKTYKDNRADILAYYQAEILKHITPDRLKKATATQLATMYGIFYDKERLERGQSTDNIEIHTEIMNLKDKLDAAKKEIEAEARQLGIEDKSVSSENP